MKAHRPKHFFREHGSMPSELELVLKLPDHFTGKAELLAELRRRIAEVEQACTHECQRTGRAVLGRRQVLRQSWRDSPTSREPRRDLRPRVASRNKWLRVMALMRNKDWQTEYREARASWLAGLPAMFPHGTYWLRRFASVHVKAPPEAN